MWLCKLAVSLFALGQVTSVALAFGGPPLSEQNGEGEPTAPLFDPQAFVTAENPKLSITYDEAQLLIAWPSWASDWILEQTPHVGLAIPWTCVPLALAQTNATSVSI